MDHHPLLSAEPSSSPSSMNEGDRRLLLLAAVSQREQTSSGSSEEEESSMPPLVSKGSSCIGLIAAEASLKNTAVAVCDGKAVALPPKKRRITSEVITPNNTAADPTTFTLNKNEDFMMQLHRNGLDQVKIPPLHKGPEEQSHGGHDVKRRTVSEGTRDVTSCGGHVYTSSSGASSQRSPQANNITGELTSLPKIVTGGSSPRSTLRRQIVMPASTSLLPPLPLGKNISGFQDNDAVRGGGAAVSMQKWGHDYHQQIMSMSMAGLSASNRMLLMQAGQLKCGMPPPTTLLCSELKGRDGSSNHLMQLQKQQEKEMIIKHEGPFKNSKGGDAPWSSTSHSRVSALNPDHSLYNMLQRGPQHEQIIQMMQHRQNAEMQTSILPDESEGPLKKKRKKRDANSRATIAQGALKCHTTKDGKPVAFPNQELYSQMLRMKSSKLQPPPQSAEELAAKMVVPFYKDWKEEQLETERTRRAAAAAAPRASSQWNPSLSVKRAESGFMYQDQEESLMIQNRVLQMERAMLHEQKQKQVQKYLKLQQGYAQGASSEHISSSDQKIQAYSNTNLRIPPSVARQMVLHEPTLLSQEDDPNMQIRLCLLELENRVRAEEHDRIIQSSQRQMSELHQRAVQLEEQLKFRELDFLTERKRLVDMQTVKRLRLQADELEKRLTM
ncbi:hypothetical protein ACHAWT_002504 [Skeletonema menzelii]